MRPLPHALLLLPMLACTGKEADTGTPNAQSCTSTVDLEFPDGTWASFDGCNDVLADATFEFDPDDPPEIRSFKMQLAGTADPGFDCWLIMTSTGLCGPGYYDIGTGHGTAVQYTIHDCPYVPDGFEDSYRASEGILYLETVSAGSEPGNHTGDLLDTHLAGAIETTTGSGVQANLTFDLNVQIRGEDAEEIDCDKAD